MPAPRIPSLLLRALLVLGPALLAETRSVEPEKVPILWFAGAGRTVVRTVQVNAMALDEARVQALQNHYRVRLPPGRYWYDRISGAWGKQGGPTEGFLAPFLPLGGPLRRDASGGRTGVLVNGRELHGLDVLALQRIVQVRPGRYWVDAQGTFGLENGPALGNLRVLAGSQGVRRQGILSTYDKVGAVVLGN